MIPKIVTFCVISANTGNYDPLKVTSAIFDATAVGTLQDHSDEFVQIFLDDSEEPDYVTPTIMNTDRPRWDFCRTVVVRTRIRFKVYDVDMLFNDHI